MLASYKFNKISYNIISALAPPANNPAPPVAGQAKGLHTPLLGSAQKCDTSEHPVRRFVVA